MKRTIRRRTEITIESVEIITVHRTPAEVGHEVGDVVLNLTLTGLEETSELDSQNELKGQFDREKSDGTSAQTKEY